MCDMRTDEGLRFRKDKDILPCITEHIHKDGGGVKNLPNYGNI